MAGLGVLRLLEVTGTQGFMEGDQEISPVCHQEVSGGEGVSGAEKWEEGAV